MNKHKGIYKYYYLILFMLTGIIWFIGSCSKKNLNEDNSQSDLVPLPDKLTEIQSSDFRPILAMLGDSKIIGVTESTHNMNEPLDFRNELIKFLVKEQRIDIVAIESGILESRHLYDYVNGKEGNIDSILFNGVSWGFDKLPQNKKLVEWLRFYNMDSTNNHKVKLYGFDMPGSPGSPAANRKMNTAIEEALKYLKLYDSENYEEFNNQLSPYIDYIHINYLDSSDTSKQYIHLDKNQRNELTGIINDMIKLYELNEINYIIKSSKEDYQWAYQATIGAKQIDNWFRTIPINYKITLAIEELIGSNHFLGQHQSRDRSMVDNLDWIMKREKNNNVLLYGHIMHLSKSPSTLIFHKIKWREQMGQYLARRFEDDYKVIGNYYYPSNNENVASRVDKDVLANYLINNDSNNYYRLVSEDDTSSLNKEWIDGEGILKRYINPYQGVDILFFNRTQTQVFK